MSPYTREIILKYVNEIFNIYDIHQGFTLSERKIGSNNLELTMPARRSRPVSSSNSGISILRVKKQEMTKTHPKTLTHFLQIQDVTGSA